MSIEVSRTFGTNHWGTSNYTASGEYTQINSYAAVTAFNYDQVTIDKANALTGIFSFDTTPPYWIMLHVTGKKQSGVNENIMGNFVCVKVTSVNGNVLTVAFDTRYLMGTYDISKYFVQAVLVGNIMNLTISRGANVQPPPFDPVKGYGGILFIKASKWIRMHPTSRITAKNKGIPTTHSQYAAKDLWTVLSGTVTDKAAGWNNSSAFGAWESGERSCRMPVGDGIIIVQAERLILMDDTVIGRKPEDADPNDKGTYSYSSRGSAQIAIVCDEIIRNGATENIFLKDWELGDHIINSRPDPIANAIVGGVLVVGNVLRSTVGAPPEDYYPATNNEATYSYNIDRDTSFAKETLGIRNYLEGKLGAAKDLTENLNNYAKVIGISEDGYSIHYRDKTEDGIAKFKVGAYVLFLVSQWGVEMDQSSDNHHPEYDLIGKFKICKVLADDGYTMILDRKPPEFRKIKKWFNDLSIQLVTIACFTDVTQTVTYNVMRPFKDGIGGVLAIACSGTLDLSNNGCLLTTTYDDADAKGIAYGRNGLRYIGNAQCKDKLPVGQGMGSAFIMAKNLNLSKTSRIGAYADGAWVGGYATKDTVIPNQPGGVKGSPVNGGGGGVSEGTLPDRWVAGGYGGNGGRTTASNKEAAGNNVDSQGAHIMCIADTIQNFTISAFSTGGGVMINNKDYYNSPDLSSQGVKMAFLSSAGAGYGAGGLAQNYAGDDCASGGYNGGGGILNAHHGSSGGSSGWCFVYCNRAGTLDNHGLIDGEGVTNLDIFNRHQNI